MATMHPIDLLNYDPTESERIFYEALKKELPPNFHVFYSVRWYETDENNKRNNSECDFLIFDPGFGFLTIEIKGGIKIEVENGNWILTEKNKKGEFQNRQLRRSPFVQAEDSMRYFYEYFKEEFNQNFKGVYGFAVGFPMYQIDEKIESTADKNLIIDIRDIGNLKKKINAIFHYWKNRLNNGAPFSTDQKQKFITLVNKRILLSAAAGALIPIKNKEIEKINIVQDSIIDFLSNYKQVKIIGGAGTGKTFMAIKKIQRLNDGNNRILFTCSSPYVASFVDNYFKNDDNIICLSLAQYFDKYYSVDVNNVGDILEKVDFDVADKFDAIIVDEAQDLNDEVAVALKLLLKDEKKSYFYVFFDENQNLFNVDFNGKFDIDERPYILRYNIRNTGAIYNYATKITYLGLDTVANNLIGCDPEVSICKNKMQVISQISKIINKLVLKEYVSCKSIVVLTDCQYEKSCLFGEDALGVFKLSNISNETDKTILVKSVSDFKGLESDVVIYLNDHSFKNIDPDIKKRIDYVAYTRAKYYLYVIDMK